MYIGRTLENFFLCANSQFSALLVTGARQVGKTTFLQHLMDPQRRYITLDDPLILDLAKGDPPLFMQQYKPPILIDEIQYAPELLPYIKMAIDADHAPGRFWLTGSQQFQLMKGVSESLAGRVAIMNLLGLSRRELGGLPDTQPFLPQGQPTSPQCKAPGADAVYKLIWQGAYPGAHAAPSVDRNLFYNSYVQTYIQRDVRDLAKVGDELAFLRFLRVCAARTAQLRNYSELARDADVSVNTAKNWLSILQASGIVHLLEPYHANVTKRLVKSPKLYFLDTGLCAFLCEWSSPETLMHGAMSGPMFETWVFTELLKSWWHNGKRAPFYFYRDKEGTEIDLLMEQDGVLHPVEIKKTASPRKQAIAQFSLLQKLGIPSGPGALICLAQEPLPLTENTWAIPAGLL